MDTDTRILIERTRQRREILNQRFAGMPEAAPRKRRTPVLEDGVSEKAAVSATTEDDSPKRQCLRDVELNVKSDTPAIKGVKSRIVDLKSGQSENDVETPTPTPRKSVSSPPLEKKNLPSPKNSPIKSNIHQSSDKGSTRKNRFAALAQDINSWEDDLTHHVIHKGDEDKKPRWQPPTGLTPQSSHKSPAPQGPASTRCVASPVKTSSHSPIVTCELPSRSYKQNVAALNPSATRTKEAHASPKKVQAPAVPSSSVASSTASSSFARNSPLRSSKVEWNRSPKPFSSAYMDNAVSPSKSVIKPVTSSVSSPKTSKYLGDCAVNRKLADLPQIPAEIPVNAPGLHETPPDNKSLQKKEADGPIRKPVSQMLAHTWVHKVQSPEPSKQPMSAKLANFEKQILQNTPQGTVPQKKSLASSMHTPKTTKQVPVSSLSASMPTTRTKSAAASDPSELPVSERMSQMQEKLAKKQHEPTAFSVGARMSAWEDMTLANKVSDIKKVDPGQSTPRPTRPVSSYMPTTNTEIPKSASAPAGSISGVPQNPPPPPPLPTMNNAAMDKSLKTSIEEKAAEVSKRTGLQYNTRSPGKPATTISKSPTKGVCHSPSKVSTSTKYVQQALADRVQHSDTTCSQMAAQMRAARSAELAALSSRWKNGILRDDTTSAESDHTSDTSDDHPSVSSNKQESKATGNKKDVIREKARAAFNSKLAEIGLDDNGPSPAAYSSMQKATASGGGTKGSSTASIYNLIKKRDETTSAKPEEIKKVKFNDGFDDSDDESDSKIPKTAAKRMAQATSSESCEDLTFKKPTLQASKEVLDNADDSASESVTSDRNSLEVTDDDISLKGFVSEAVRRESIFGDHYKRRPVESSSSLDSYDDRIESKTVSAKATSSRTASYISDDDDSLADDDMSDDGNNRKAVSDLLDDALSDTFDEDCDPNMEMRKEQERNEIKDDYDPDMDINNVVMRRKPGQSTAGSYNTNSMESTEDDDDDDRPYSIQAYRKSANVHQHMIPPVVRSSKYVGRQVEEEDVPMPYSQPSRVDDRRAVQDRIKELKDLVQQEQSVIMQTSNALNKCCVGNPVFAGSSEQVECNRVLLLACQKRQCYMTEIERLKSTAQLSPDGPGPRGSLTISDIRLPLKKEFVTKIGSSHDTTTHFFILLIRNGPQLICTQMLSTHDPMMRGSLDFPNLIKINGITGNFKLTLDIYGMSVSKEISAKDKKKKTPKKQTPKKHKGFPLESPGGPTAVRTTSFSHVTSLELTKKSLDKSSFHLDRLSYLSPLYGQIYMRLKCLMESNVEERGFLTMFDDVSGFGAWHRRWCVLTGNKLCIWKYPDDETRKDPMSLIDLKRCVSEKVGLVSRDICARPNTFEMVTVRQPLRGEHDTLVTRTYNSTTSVKHLVSADSKEERIVWCNKINHTLANLRTWNADALKPMRPAPPSNKSTSSSSSYSRRH